MYEGAQNFMQEVLSALSADHRSFSLFLFTLQTRGSTLHHHLRRKSVTLGLGLGLGLGIKISWGGTHIQSVFSDYTSFTIQKSYATSVTKHRAASTVPDTVANKSRSSWARDRPSRIRSVCKLLHTHRPPSPRRQ